GDSRIEVTAVEAEGRRVAAARAKEVGTVWAKRVDRVRVKFSVNKGNRTVPHDVLAAPDEEFEIGEIVDLGRDRAVVHHIRTRQRTVRQGRVRADDIVRMYGRIVRERFWRQVREVVLIDEDSRVVLRRVWGEMSVRERIRLLTSALGAFFTRKEKVEAELQRFYRDEQSFLREFAAELPTAKRILIDERDAAMARTLRQLAESRGEVVAVVGEGHVDGLLHQLDGVPVDVVHLEQLRSV